MIISSEGPGDTVTLGPLISGEWVEDLAPNDPEAVYVSARSFAQINLYSIFKLDPVSGATNRVYAGKRETGKWIMDGEGSLVARIDVLDYGEEDAIFVPDGDGGFRQVGIINDTLENTGDVLGLATDNVSSLVARSRRGGVREGLYSYDLNSGTWGDEIFLNPDSDVVGVLRDRRRQIVGVTYYEEGVLRPTYFSPEDQEVQEVIGAALNGFTIYIVSRSANGGDRLLLAASSPIHPPDFYVFDSSTGRLVPLGGDYPALGGVTLGETRPHTYVASDGTELTGLLTLPAAAQASNLPMIVILPGPSGFERLGFNWMAHFLANQGYAVFHAGARQNLGFGELYGEGMIEEWVETAHGDIAQAIASLAESGIVDGDRVCNLGNGDDGYLSVIGAALTQGQYACAISLFGFFDPLAVKRNLASVRDSTTIINSCLSG